jgi:hypothetical protein
MHKLTGLFFLSEKAVTGRSYLDMLMCCPSYHLKLSSNKLELHFCHHVRNHLDREIAGRWIGRGGPIAWLPRSPVLSPVDFLLWDYVKNIAYQVKMKDLQHLKALTKDAVATVTQNMLQATWNEVEYRLDICRANKGAHTEIY